MYIMHKLEIKIFMKRPDSFSHKHINMYINTLTYTVQCMCVCVCAGYFAATVVTWLIRLLLA